MADRLQSVKDLLNLADSTDDETVRLQALHRVAARTVRQAGRTHDGLRGASVCVERLLDQFRSRGIPEAPRVLDPEAVPLARTLANLGDSVLDRAAFALGVVETVALAQALERDEAADVLRAIESVRDHLGKLAAHSPKLTPEGRIDSLRRFKSLVPRGFAGAALARALGRSLLARLIAGAEPDVVAVLRLRLPRVGQADTRADATWFPVVSNILADIRSAEIEEPRAH